jgi:hypothetical protein
MTKEFVPYQEALELKQLGFDEPCFGKYLSSLQSNWKVYELILEMGMNEEFEDNRNVYLSQGACSAPTYSQAFRWFREKYQLRFCIIDDHSHNEKPYSFTSEHEYYYDTGSGNDWFKSYEEAELECLRKLIEIVKQNG